jgi:hypothetical protein
LARAPATAGNRAALFTAAMQPPTIQANLATRISRPDDGLSSTTPPF